MRFQVAHGGEDVFVKRSAVNIAEPGAGGWADAAKVDGEHVEAAIDERAGLIAPTLLVEPAAVREDEAARSRAVQVGIDAAAVAGGEGDGLLRGGSEGERGREEKRSHITAPI